jgi:hypothetical protein
MGGFCHRGSRSSPLISERVDPHAPARGRRGEAPPGPMSPRPCVGSTGTAVPDRPGASEWHVAQLMNEADRRACLAQIATFPAPLRDIQTRGLPMFMISAIDIRLFPVIFGIRKTPDRRAWTAVGLPLAAVVDMM